MGHDIDSILDDIKFKTLEIEEQKNKIVTMLIKGQERQQKRTVWVMLTVILALIGCMVYQNYKFDIILDYMKENQEKEPISEETADIEIYRF